MVVEHEDVCKFGILDRLELENQNLKLQAQENEIIVQSLVKQVELLTKQMKGLMKRHSVTIANEKLYNFDAKKDMRIGRDFYKQVLKLAPNVSQRINTFIELLFLSKPVFYKLGKKNDKLQIKGVIGHINGQPVGIPNSVTTIPFTRFYTVFIDNIIDIIVDYKLENMINSTETEETDKMETDKMEDICRKPFGYYFRADKFNKDSKRHNHAYNACRTNTITVMYNAMAKRIKKETLNTKNGNTVSKVLVNS